MAVACKRSMKRRITRAGESAESINPGLGCTVPVYPILVIFGVFDLKHHHI